VRIFLDEVPAVRMLVQAHASRRRASSCACSMQLQVWHMLNQPAFLLCRARWSRRCRHSTSCWKCAPSATMSWRQCTRFASQGFRTRFVWSISAFCPAAHCCLCTGWPCGMHADYHAQMCAPHYLCVCAQQLLAATKHLTSFLPAAAGRDDVGLGAAAQRGDAQAPGGVLRVPQPAALLVAVCHQRRRRWRPVLCPSGAIGGRSSSQAAVKRPLQASPVQHSKRLERSPADGAAPWQLAGVHPPCGDYSLPCSGSRTCYAAMPSCWHSSKPDKGSSFGARR
jgi:hypothetical protein